VTGAVAPWGTSFLNWSCCMIMNDLLIKWKNMIISTMEVKIFHVRLQTHTTFLGVHEPEIKPQVHVHKDRRRNLQVSEGYPQKH
jgi:hypothetical protein